MEDEEDERGAVGVLGPTRLNPAVLRVRYAVRGPILQRALQLERELSQGVPHPFTEVIRANLGDAQAMGQKPITFVRQVAALCVYPELLNGDFPEDAKARARRLLQECGGHSVGSYSSSAGLDAVREDVARFLQRRDGFPACPQNIFLSSGASEAIVTILKLLLWGSGPSLSGVLTPVPQYPLYGAALAELGAVQLPYELCEEQQWRLDVTELRRVVKAARGRCCPRALCVINPGNPTGSVQSRECIEAIVRLAFEERLFLLADEVYQDNVYDGAQFHPFRRVLLDLGPPYSSAVQLASFHSVSKGVLGECGFRAGFMEVLNVAPEVLAQLHKMAAVRLCPPVMGQVLLSAALCAPQPGEPSYDTYLQERSAVLQSLSERAALLWRSLNGTAGIECQPIRGAMYGFPRMRIPERAVKAAKELGLEADEFFCHRLLEQTGICVVPGSGFGQHEGTFHFRMTILPPMDRLQRMVQTICDFYTAFVREFS